MSCVQANFPSSRLYRLWCFQHQCALAVEPELRPVRGSDKLYYQGHSSFYPLGIVFLGMRSIFLRLKYASVPLQKKNIHLIELPILSSDCWVDLCLRRSSASERLHSMRTHCR